MCSYFINQRLPFYKVYLSVHTYLTVFHLVEQYNLMEMGKLGSLKRDWKFSVYLSRRSFLAHVRVVGDVYVRGLSILMHHPGIWAPPLGALSIYRRVV